MNYREAMNAVIKSHEEKVSKAVTKMIDDVIADEHATNEDLDSLGAKAASAVRKIVREMAEEIAKIVRDATLRFYEAKKKEEPVPQDVLDFPLMRQLPLPAPYIPKLPTGTGDPPPIRSVTTSP